MRLPQEINLLLTSRMGAYYRPDPQGVTNTLGFGPDELRAYLGTYWPRSFTESCHVFHALLHNPAFCTALKKKNRLRILDIGAGTGGDLMGLLWLLRACGGNGRWALDVTAIDGNEKALAIQAAILKPFFGDSLQLRSIPHIFRNREDLERILPQLADAQNDRYDIVISSKFVNEFYRTPENYTRNQGLYTTLMRIAGDSLAPTGCAILIDVNDKCYGGFFSQILNRETRKYLSTSREGLVPIFPIPCLLWHNQCASSHDCFNQAIYPIAHTMLPRNIAEDRCKIAVKVLAHSHFAQAIANRVRRQTCYAVAWSPRGTDVCRNGRRFSTNNPTPPDGYSFEQAG